MVEKDTITLKEKMKRTVNGANLKTLFKEEFLELSVFSGNTGYKKFNKPEVCKHDERSEVIFGYVIFGKYEFSFGIDVVKSIINQFFKRTIPVRHWTADYERTQKEANDFLEGNEHLRKVEIFDNKPPIMSEGDDDYVLAWVKIPQ